MKQSIILAILFSLSFLSLKTSGQVFEITYHSFQNGIENENGKSTIELADEVAFLSPEDANIQSYIDYRRKEVTKIIEYKDTLYRMSTPFDSLAKGKWSGKLDTILGIECQEMVFDYFSNKVEVYFSENTGKRGGPYSNFIPTENALVLKVLINGNRELIASKIDTLDREVVRNYPYDNAEPIAEPVFEEMRIKSRFTSLSVFKNQQINFDPSIPNPDWNNVDDKVLRLANGSLVLKKIRLPEICKQGAYTYLRLNCRSNGDAYDRTGSVFAIIPTENQTMLDAFRDSIEVVPSFTDKTGRIYHGFRLVESFTPTLELMRFFTSFGAGHFNDKRVINHFDWKETARYAQDISALIPDDDEEIWIGAFIGNYSKEGHLIDLTLDFYPAFEEDPVVKKWIQPLFNTVNIMEMAGQEYPRLFKTDTLTVTFDIPENVHDLKLLYTSTGHGGWGEGDEFNPRLNELFLDGQRIFDIIPWRTDCARYRLSNPASGNFENGMSSSDFSRSNWCPATSTPPYQISLNDVSPGKHSLKVAIDQGDDAGSSFNAWNVSGVLVGKL